jgi:hypothetical protein
MEPAHIRVDPWLWNPIRERKGRLLPVLIVGAACAAAGFMTGRQYQRGNSEPFPTEVVAKNSTVPKVGTPKEVDSADSARSSTVEFVTKNSAVGQKDVGQERALERKGENGDAYTEITQANPRMSNVVVLNPGTADRKGNLRRKVTAQARTGTRPSDRPPAHDVRRPDFANGNASDDRLSTSRSAIQDYADLRNYMLKR